MATTTSSLANFSLQLTASSLRANFFFHATTAYDILRHAGVDLGKRNFIGKV